MNPKQHTPQFENNMEQDDPALYHPDLYSPPEQMPEGTKMHINDVLFSVVPPETTVQQLEEIAMATYASVLKLWEKHEEKN